MYLLYHPTTRPTGESLARSLGLPHGSSYGGDRLEVLLRWGSQTSVDYRPERTINTRLAISRASNKLKALEIFRDMGLSVPQFSEDLSRVLLPALGRSISHTRGSDIVLYMNNSDLQFSSESDFYVNYIPTKEEYRVLVYKEKVVRTLLKELSTEVLSTSTNIENIVRVVPWVRNHGSGYVFRGVTQRTRGSMIEQMALTAVRTLGLDFGAVDLIVGEDNHTYVLEVNTAPSCSPTTLRMLAEHVAEDLELEVDVDYIDSLRGDGVDE